MMAAAQETEPGAWGSPARSPSLERLPRWWAVLKLTPSAAVPPLVHPAELSGRVDALIAGGAAGALLVNEGLGHQPVLRLARDLARERAEIRVGICCLDLRPQDVIHRVAPEVAAIWCPFATLSAGGAPALAGIVRARRECGWNGLMIGGVPACRATPAHLPELRQHADVLDVLAIEPAARSLFPPVLDPRLPAALPHTAFALPHSPGDPAVPPPLRSWPLLETSWPLRA